MIKLYMLVFPSPNRYFRNVIIKLLWNVPLNNAIGTFNVVNFFNASQSQLVAVLHCLNKWITENFSINSYAVLNWVSSYWIFHLPRENFLLPELSFICISDIQAPHWSRVQLSVSDWLKVTRLIPLYLVWWWLSPGVLHSLTHTICHNLPLEQSFHLSGTTYYPLNRN